MAVFNFDTDTDLFSLTAGNPNEAKWIGTDGSPTPGCLHVKNATEPWLSKFTRAYYISTVPTARVYFNFKLESLAWSKIVLEIKMLNGYIYRDVIYGQDTAEAAIGVWQQRIGFGPLNDGQINEITFEVSGQVGVWLDSLHITEIPPPPPGGYLSNYNFSHSAGGVPGLVRVT